ncbi:uncharacterized protein LY79DRAFT_538517 [Colletotrichum navitas]|uniref:Uncharacterized protein n=1 Tax=Colletotrichum navitas TaxID=681940 RepID=A0AAD8V8G6_9PEZI|nr:uncharacterized protein LY79DRAFT_538517 [Colletotrichum navitas]KAK1598217.1 hypothetical protein LY79DRAFT_538517 [Colletotrichum navitas]
MLPLHIPYLIVVIQGADSTIALAATSCRAMLMLRLQPLWEEPGEMADSARRPFIDRHLTAVAPTSHSVGDLNRVINVTRHTGVQEAQAHSSDETRQAPTPARILITIAPASTVRAQP